MTRETKIGLLLGMGVILLIGIIISDQLSQVQQDPADFTNFASEAQRSIDASDASPATAPGAGSIPIYAPGKTPATPDTATDEVPGSFFIPEDVQVKLPQRQADATGQTATDGQMPAPAYNIDNDTRATQPQDDHVPTIVVGEPNPGLPHYNVHVEPSQPPTHNAMPPATAQTPAGNATIQHTVRESETLFKIAQRYYGDGEYWRAIQFANPGKVTRKGGVYAGTVLNIPKRDDALLNAQFQTVGNETVLRVDTANTPRNTTTASTARTILVEPGDTLSELASKHLGSAARWKELLAANSDKLDSAQDLQAGMKLKLPGQAVQAQAPTSSTNTNTTRARSNGKTYKVKANDNLTDIAEKTLGDGGKWRLIYDANRDKLKDPDRLVVGQELRIPS